ncbi:MAG: rod shape-determining protein MreD [Bacteroidota bacterium]|nr:rod shape-determining protein MreD [Bacteroidota bacterium]
MNFLNILRFIVLVLLQVLVLNSININGYIDPYLYVYFVLLLPFDVKPWVLLLISFVLGATIDVFSNTAGIHAAATTFMAFMRPSIIRLLSRKQNYDSDIKPGIRDMGLGWFYKYSLLLIFMHHAALFGLEAFKLNTPMMLLYRISLSAAITLVLVIIGQYLFMKKIK